jgi:hypothetical protein
MMSILTLSPEPMIYLLTIKLLIHILACKYRTTVWLLLNCLIVRINRATAGPMVMAAVAVVDLVRAMQDEDVAVEAQDKAVVSLKHSQMALVVIKCIPLQLQPQQPQITTLIT